MVLVSGRSRRRLEAVAQALGADGVLPEMGATDAGYPTAEGQTVHEAIAQTGVLEALMEREPGLAHHPMATWGREGSHVLIGRAGPEAAALVEERSGGTLRLADNGQTGADGAHIWHLLPAAASKAAAVTRDSPRGAPTRPPAWPWATAPRTSTSAASSAAWRSWPTAPPPTPRWRRGPPG